jgi:hypothetical protein
MPGGGLSTPGAMSVTEGHDTFAGSGTATMGLVGLEGQDAPAIVGSFAIFASMDVTEGPDLANLIAVDTAFGSFALTAGNDSPSISGMFTVTGPISLAGGTDVLAADGIFTAAGSASSTEGHDAPSLAGLFLASGSIGVTAGNDAPSLAGISSYLGMIAVNESAGTPSMAGAFTAAASIARTEGHDTAAMFSSLATSATLSDTEGHDAMAGFSGDLEYHIYSNTGAGDPINYTTAIATTGLLEWTSSPLTFPGIWRFGVRAFNPVNSLEEENLDCLITIILDASGNDITNRPLPPTALRAFATAGGGIRVEWAYNTINPSPVPTGFHVYIGTPGTPNYSLIVAAVSFQASIAGTFVANVAGLANGTTYTIGVRAYNATAEEPNTNTVNVTAISVGPTAVIDLAATAIV